ncbi:MAG: ATP-binding cassette domain-containing protein [Bacillota bacterium]
MVIAEKLTKRFGNLTAVDRVSFQCRPGEVLGLLGENGAGKTTTLRMLATILEPSEGTATVAGYDLRRQPEEVRRNIGIVFGEGGLYDRLTARETVRFFGRLHGMDDQTIAARTDELFRLLDLAEAADRRTGKFSKGMKQKVAIARALIHDPPVLILDEPTAGLDVTSSRVVDELIRTARQNNKAVIFSSHIMSEVEELCDRVAIIHRGQIIVTSTVQELKAGHMQDKFEDIFVRLVGEGR